MATDRVERMIGPMATLFCLGRLADWTDGELLDWSDRHRATGVDPVFEELVRRHGRMVLDVCRRVLRDPNDVEDAFQATFLVLIRRAGSIRERDALGGWLHRVALRVAFRARSGAARRRHVEGQVAGSELATPTTDEAEQADIRRALHEELGRLPASFRAALVACYLEGLTHEQAATRLRWPVGTVRSRLARGRDRLRVRLARRGFAPALILPALAGPPALVPAALNSRTVRSLVAHGSIAGQVPAPVASLTKSVIRSMKLQTWKTASVLCLTVGTLAGMVPTLVAPALRRASASITHDQEPAPPPPVVLAGVIRDGEGQPVAAATVVAGAFNNEPNHRVATTDVTGRFAFRAEAGAPRLEYALAYKAGLAPASKFHGSSTGKPAAVDLELTLLKPEPFVGTIRDEEGKPIINAQVRIAYMRGRGGEYDFNPVLKNVLQGSPLETLCRTTTDPQGGFRFPAVPAPQGIVIRASAPGMADLSTEISQDFKAGFITGTAVAPAQLTMEPEAQIQGRIVTNLPGVNVAGLRIGLQNTNDSVGVWRDGWTDAEGRFVMRGLPEGRFNLFPMDLDARGDGPWTYRAVEYLRLRSGRTAEAEIELIAGVMVTGRVVDAQGKPAVGAGVGMYGPARPRSGAAILRAMPDERGVYRFRLPPGETTFYNAGQVVWRSGGLRVQIPADVPAFTVPDIILERTEEPHPGP